MAIERGCTRVVLLVGKYAIKFPSGDMGYRGFLKGILDNLGEAGVSKWSPALSVTKTLYCNCSGLVLVAERARQVQHVGLYQVDLARLCAIDPLHSQFYKDDAKPDNFGYDEKNRLVKLDYARHQIA
jgi:hypothetical protein